MCTQIQRKLCDDNNCIICFKRSFASHIHANKWSDKNIVNPREIFRGTDKKFWFNCDICNHEFEMRVDCITNQNQWCNYCAGKRLCNNDCNYCFERSFASHKKSKFWPSENKLTPREIFQGSQLKYKFVCEYGHKFESMPNLISRLNNWCSQCRYKTERLLLDKLVEYGYAVSTQVKFDWCKNKETNFFLPFDFVIDEYKIIIELDGSQHFRQVSNWQSPDEQQKRDKYKMERANENGYTIIRILQEDVWNNRENWLEKLESNIYFHDKPTKCYISTNSIYDMYDD